MVEVLKVVSNDFDFGSILDVEDIVYFWDFILKVLLVEFKILCIYMESVDVFWIGY